MKNQITISEITIHIEGNFPDSRLVELSKVYLSVYEDSSTELINKYFPVYEISLTKGSLKTKGTILIAAAIISQYGSIRSGINHIVDDITLVNHRIVSVIKTRMKKEGKNVGYSRSVAGDLDRIERLFRKVEKGELSSKEAFNRTRKILSEDEIVEQLRNEFKDAQPYQSDIKTIHHDIVKKEMITIEKPRIAKIVRHVYTENRKPKSVTIRKDTRTGKTEIIED